MSTAQSRNPHARGEHSTVYLLALASIDQQLLISQIIRYHRGDKSLGFLNLGKIANYDDLNRLFFSVLAKKQTERSKDIQNTHTQVPYLNSSLFEPTDLEQSTIVISNLRSENLEIFAGTVLKDSQGKKRTGEINALAYPSDL